MLCSEELQKIEELQLRLNRPYELMIFNVLHVKVHKNRNWEKAEQVWFFCKSCQETHLLRTAKRKQNTAA